jgi:hypothetical protein
MSLKFSPDSSFRLAGSSSQKPEIWLEFATLAPDHHFFTGKMAKKSKKIF